MALDHVPRRRPTDLRLRRRGSGRKTPGSTAYPEAKAAWGHQHACRAGGVPKACRAAAPRDPRDRVIAALREPQLPAVPARLPDTTHDAGPPAYGAVSHDTGKLPAWGAATHEIAQGGERGTLVALARPLFGSAGSPEGREPYGDGASVVVRGRESRPHGEGGQVAQVARGLRCARCETPRRPADLSHWRAV